MNSPEGTMDFVVPDVAKILRDEDATYQTPHIAHRLGGLFIPPHVDAGFHNKLHSPEREEPKQQPINKIQQQKEWDDTSLISQIKLQKARAAHLQRMSIFDSVLADIRN